MGAACLPNEGLAKMLFAFSQFLLDGVLDFYSISTRFLDRRGHTVVRDACSWPLSREQRHDLGPMLPGHVGLPAWGKVRKVEPDGPAALGTWLFAVLASRRFGNVHSKAHGFEALGVARAATPRLARFRLALFKGRRFVGSWHPFPAGLLPGGERDLISPPCPVVGAGFFVVWVSLDHGINLTFRRLDVAFHVLFRCRGSGLGPCAEGDISHSGSGWVEAIEMVEGTRGQSLGLQRGQVRGKEQCEVVPSVEEPDRQSGVLVAVRDWHPGAHAADEPDGACWEVLLLA